MTRLPQLLVLLVLLVLFSACTQRAADLVPDSQPQVAISKINNVDTRNPLFDRVWVPASTIIPAEVLVTASDEDSISRVELFVNDQSVGVLTPQVDGTDVEFKNPFAFRVTSFAGSSATLRAVATDSSGQTSEFEMDALVDSTPPVVDVSVSGLEGDTPGSVQGSVVANFSVSDPQSGIADIQAFFDGQPVSETGAVVINVEEVGDGAHFVSIFATNSAGVTSGDVATFIVDNPEPEQPAPANP
jgi:hypothetical protein